MKMKTTTMLGILLIIVLAVVYLVMQNTNIVAVTPKVPIITATTTPQVATSTSVTEMITVQNVSANETIVSPLTITGNARGTWFFEGSFPVLLEDGSGMLVTSNIATTTSNWMTVNFIPFAVTLTFTKPTTATGTLIFRKDNPSGDPMRDQSFRIPVRF